MRTIPKEITRKLSTKEIKLARQMYNVGMEAGEYMTNVGLAWADFKKNEILTFINSDPEMANFFNEVFERGKSMGERRKHKNRFFDISSIGKER
ncbi:MAG: hypothetical protein JSW00_02135 [Thermoplasmata archaeon]|nr:MAG: hypothetical protein JSW00_02135 [Thermoplasmata archaeon]